MTAALSWTVGDVRVTRVVDMSDFTIEPEFLFDLTHEQVRKHGWMQPHFTTPEGQLLVSVHAFVIEAGDRRILVDTCLGNDKTRNTAAWNMRTASFLEDLTAAGFPPESIDTVVCTYLHVDHVGWNTRLQDGRWIPTFPNADYLFGRIEWDHWRGEMEEEARQVAAGDDEAAQLLQVGIVMGDSVLPVIEAGLHKLVEIDHRISPEVYLQPTPGHTPGHVSVHISSKGEEAVITGDMMHHPIQCMHPELGAHVDWSNQISTETRRAFCREHADRPIMILGTHFPTPTAGWLVTDKGGEEGGYRVLVRRPASGRLEAAACAPNNRRPAGR